MGATSAEGTGRRALRGAVVLGAAGLLALASWWSADHVQRDLDGRARSALGAAGITAAVRFDGRDATVTGQVADAEQARAARAVVRNLWGVSRVTTELAVRTPAATPTPQSPAPTPSPSPTATPVVVWPQGSIRFDTGQVALTASARSYLDRVAGYLQQTPTIVVVIRGFADSAGAVDTNRALSQNRADAVVAYLTARGVGTGRLRTASYGADHPVTSNDTPLGRAVNRRVEIVFQEGA